MEHGPRLTSSLEYMGERKQRVWKETKLSKEWQHSFKMSFIEGAGPSGRKGRLSQFDVSFKRTQWEPRYLIFLSLSHSVASINEVWLSADPLHGSLCSRPTFLTSSQSQYRRLHFWAHFRDQETKVWGDEVTCSYLTHKSQSLGLSPGSWIAELGTTHQAKPSSRNVREAFPHLNAEL